MVIVGRKVLMLMALSFMTACGPPPPNVITTDLTLVEVPKGILKNSDLTINATDGSFSLKGGEEFDTPFSIDLNRSTCPDDKGGDLISRYPAVLGCGAKSVEILQEGHDKKLYGVLHLSKSLKAVTGPASRSYFIQIPDRKLQEARDGNITFAFERASFLLTYSDGKTENGNLYSWIIWISAFPLE